MKFFDDFENFDYPTFEPVLDVMPVEDYQPVLQTPVQTPIAEIVQLVQAPEPQVFYPEEPRQPTPTVMSYVDAIQPAQVFQEAQPVYQSPIVEPISEPIVENQSFQLLPTVSEPEVERQPVTNQVSYVDAEPDQNLESPSFQNINFDDLKTIDEPNLETGNYQNMKVIDDYYDLYDYGYSAPVYGAPYDEPYLESPVYQSVNFDDLKQTAPAQTNVIESYDPFGNLILQPVDQQPQENQMISASYIPGYASPEYNGGSYFGDTPYRNYQYGDYQYGDYATVDEPVTVVVTNAGTGQQTAINTTAQDVETAIENATLENSGYQNLNFDDLKNAAPTTNPATTITTTTTTTTATDNKTTEQTDDLLFGLPKTQVYIVGGIAALALILLMGSGD